MLQQQHHFGMTWWRGKAALWLTPRRLLYKGKADYIKSK
jgi:hypothetical protein